MPKIYIFIVAAFFSIKALHGESGKASRRLFVEPTSNRIPEIGLNARLLSSDSSKKKVKFSISGSINVGLWYQTINSATLQRKTLEWFVQGQPTFAVNSYTFPFSGIYSNNEFNYTQPFNQIGISPKFKKFTAHLGYRNLSFSNYTLAGATFLGGGFEYNPGKLRLMGFYGRFNRAIGEDTLNNYGVNFTVIPTFERWGYGLKIGVGTKSNFLDLIVTHIKDDTASINRPIKSAILPGENLSVGLLNKLSFGKVFRTEAEVAVSVLTENLYKPEITTGIPESVSKFIELNSSSTANPAAKFLAGLSIKNFDLTGQFEYIGANFRSLAMYFMQNDVMRYSVSPSLRLFKGRLTLAGSVGLQSDNVAEQKIITTTRLIQSANVGIMPLKNMMFQVQYSNFGTDQSSGKIQLNDSIKISQVNSSYGGTWSYTLPGKRVTSNVMLSTNKQSVNDFNIVTARFSASDVLVGTANGSFSLNKIKTTFGLGYMYNEYSNYAGNYQTAGPSTSISWAQKKGKFRVNASYTHQQRFKEQVLDGKIQSLSINVNYQIKKKHKFGVRTVFSNNTTSSTSFQIATQQRLGFNYGYTF